MPESGLYIHIPFCLRRCAYCDFDSSVLGDGPEVEKYADAVAIESRASSSFLPGLTVQTAYLGGGTPTAIGAGPLAGLVDSVFSSFDTSAVVEFTCEANPENVDAEILEAVRAFGVNRLSLGIQSFNDALLGWMGRLHTAAEAVAAYEAARINDFENVSLDLMYGVPGQTRDGWLDDVSRLIDLEPEHISTYCLQLGSGAPLVKERRGINLPDDEIAVEMYYAAKEVFEAAGYRHYEISNFAKPGFECRHNVNYWRNGEYLGLGPSAASHVGGARYTNPHGLDAYTTAVAVGRWPLAAPEPSDPAREARTALVLGLRMLEGVDAADFKARYDFGVADTTGEDIGILVDAGLLEHNGGVVRLTRRGLFLSDEVFSRLI
ncbi:MAG: radical SAM family heme chaperone HemW [Candidatus Coatesbacteria bacterium]|nr:MAG: radical SAM family heme chaperone HemW [Candidatus Coatesbacteria bacterium]